MLNRYFLKPSTTTTLTHLQQFILKNPSKNLTDPMSLKNEVSHS